MNPMTRTAVAGAIAAAVSLGAAAPAAFAAPHSAHVKVDHKSTKAHSPVKGAKALTAAQRVVVKQAALKSAYLGRLAGSTKVTSLEDTAESAVVANIAGDQAELSGVATTLAAGTGVKDMRAQLRAYRPEVYNTIINDLRIATTLQAAVTDPAQADALAALVTTLESYDATTSRADLNTLKQALEAIEDSLTTVTDPGTTDPGTTDPGTTDPGTTDPGTTDPGTGTTTP